MFGSFFYNPFQRQQQQTAPTAPTQRPPNPKGAEYNVPLQNIAPGPNQVNIQGDAGAPDQAAAFQAFSDLYGPMVQNQAALITGSNARPINAQGAPIPGAPQQYDEEDINNALFNMFNRMQAAGTLSRFRGFSSGQRRQY
jgi:hypothetical protein